MWELFPEFGQNHPIKYNVQIPIDLHLQKFQYISGGYWVATAMNDEFVSTEHLFVSCLEVPSAARDLLSKFKIDKERVFQVVNEIKQGRVPEKKGEAKNKATIESSAQRTTPHAISTKTIFEGQPRSSE
jgi:ATP-dependent Clp protease ATP-binding subunit ClpA